MGVIVDKKKVKVAQGFVRIPLSKLDKAPWNYKKDDPEKAKKLLANIKKNGQIENIIVRPMGKSGRYEVVNGNHRFDAFHEAEVAEPMCFNLGTISQAAAERIAIETNETFFDNDPMKLAGLVKDIREEFDEEDLLESFPFDKGELDAMIEMFEHPAAVAEKKKDKFTNPTVGAVSVPVSELLGALGIKSVSVEQGQIITDAIVDHKEERGVSAVEALVDLLSPVPAPAPKKKSSK